MKYGSNLHVTFEDHCKFSVLSDSGKDCTRYTRFLYTGAAKEYFKRVYYLTETAIYSCVYKSDVEQTHTG